MCEFSTRLMAWHDGELPEDEAVAFEQHVRVCSECRNRLDAYTKVSGMVELYCDATLASKSRTGSLPYWAPVLGAAASVAVLLLLFVHTRAERSAPNHPAVAVADAALAVTPASIHETGATPVVRKVRKQRVAVTSAEPQGAKLGAAWPPSEPAIRIAIPGEEILPPGALPPGVDFVADVNIAADGSAQRLRLQPRLTGFEGGPNQ